MAGPHLAGKVESTAAACPVWRISVESAPRSRSHLSADRHAPSFGCRSSSAFRGERDGLRARASGGHRRRRGGGSRM